jgi:monoamine oxidase
LFLFFLLPFVCVLGNDEFRVEGGYKRLVDALSFGMNFLLNFVVSNVTYHQSNKIISVKSEDGRVIYAKKCVVTLPLTVLKGKLICFEPSLPIPLENAICQMEMHSGTKIFVCFKSRFWNEEILTYLCNHLGQLKRWWSSHDQPILCCYVTSNAADSIDKLDDYQLIELVIVELNRLYPRWSQQFLREQFSFLKRSSWAKQKWVGGAYAFCPTGTANARVILSQPIFDNNLCFAGEHTSYQSNPQTVHGAYDSGFAAVDKLFSKTSKL